MIKLIACDMDGTLLDSQKRLPPELPEVIAQLREKGVIFCVASGRQYASLRRDFEAYADDLLFLCENGALVMQRDKRVLIDPVDASFITRIVTATRALSGVYPVVCRADVALIEKTASPEFIRNTKMYYPSVEVVDDLTALGQLGDVCKVAFYDEGDAQTHELPELKKHLEGPLAVIIETCLLTEEEKIRMCDIVSQSDADFIKTSTGFSTAGATFDDVALMKAHMKPGKGIKAAGGIASLDDAYKFIELGATRLGTSRIVKLVKNEEATGY